MIFKVTNAAGSESSWEADEMKRDGDWLELRKNENLRTVREGKIAPNLVNRITLVAAFYKPLAVECFG